VCCVAGKKREHPCISRCIPDIPASLCSRLCAAVSFSRYKRPYLQLSDDGRHCIVTAKSRPLSQPQQAHPPHTSHHNRTKKSLGTRSFWLVLIRVWVTIHKTISDLWLCLSPTWPSDHATPSPCTPHTLSPHPWTNSPIKTQNFLSLCSRFFSRFVRAHLCLPGIPPPSTTPQTRYIPHPTTTSTPAPAMTRRLLFLPSPVPQRRASLLHSNRCVVHPSVRPGRILNRS